MKRNLSIGLWSLLLVVSTFYRLDTPLLRAEEPRRAVVSLEMMEDQNYLNPSVLGKPYLNKPFFFNAVQAVSFQAFGVNEIAARLPSTLAFLLTALLLVGIGKVLGNRSDGWLAAVIFLSFGDLLFYGGINSGELDLFFVFWLTFFLFGWLWWVHKNQYSGVVIAALGLILAFLTKGLPAIAFGVLSMVATTRSRKKIPSIAVVLVCIGLGALIYLNGYSHSGNWAALLEKLIWETGEKASIKHWYQIGLITAIPALLKLTLPYLLVVFLVKPSGSSKLPRWFWWWLGLNLLPYLISGTVKDRYLYIFLPMIAWALAHYWFNGSSRFGSNPRLRWIWAGLVVVASGAVLIQSNPSWLGVYVVFSCVLAFILLIINASDRTVPITFALIISAGLFCLKVTYKEGVLVRTEPAGLSYQYKTDVFQMNKLSQGERLVYFDRTIRREGELPVFNESFEVELAPLLPYQIPWEWRKRSGELLFHRSDVDSYVGYILMPAELMKEVPNIAEIYRFRDHWLNRDLVLVLKPK
jgi:4-amino-4-deoxy-L-arabinose transferase-like glycosyltransferase